MDEWAGHLYFQSAYIENMILYVGRTDAEAPILWLPDVKSHSSEKTLMLVKIEGRRKRGW